MKRLSINEHKKFVADLAKAPHEGELDEDLADPQEPPNRRSEKSAAHVLEILDELELKRGAD